jgi:hypothetical protein
MVGPLGNSGVDCRDCRSGVCNFHMGPDGFKLLMPSKTETNTKMHREGELMEGASLQGEWMETAMKAWLTWLF